MPNLKSGDPVVHHSCRMYWIFMNRSRHFLIKHGTAALVGLNPYHIYIYHFQCIRSGMAAKPCHIVNVALSFVTAGLQLGDRRYAGGHIGCGVFLSQTEYLWSHTGIEPNVQLIRIWAEPRACPLSQATSATPHNTSSPSLATFAVLFSVCACRPDRQ